MGIFSGKEQRYREHQDALAQAEKLVTRFRKGSGFDLAGIDLEFHAALASALEDLAYHVENTLIPSQLGNKDFFRELVERLTVAQKLCLGHVPLEGRRAFRTEMFERLFAGLKYLIDESGTGSSNAYALTQRIPLTEQAMTWLASDPRVTALAISENEARRLIAEGKRIVEGTSKAPQKDAATCAVCEKRNEPPSAFCNACGRPLGKRV